MIKTLAHFGGFIIHHTHEALAQFLLHIGVVDQIGDSRTDIAERRAAAFSQGMQHLIAAGFLLNTAGNIFNSQHVTRHRGVALRSGREDGDHLGPQQLAATGCRDEVGNSRLAGSQALPNDLLRMLNLVFFED